MICFFRFAAHRNSISKATFFFLFDLFWYLSMSTIHCFSPFISCILHLLTRDEVVLSNNILLKFIFSFECCSFKLFLFFSFYQTDWTIIALKTCPFVREGVGTSTIRTSTGQKFQNVEMVFLVDQNVEIRTSKMSFELITTTTIRTSKIDFRRSDLSQRHR
jgi:hypothetical protein